MHELTKKDGTVIATRGSKPKRCVMVDGISYPPNSPLWLDVADPIPPVPTQQELIDALTIFTKYELLKATKALNMWKTTIKPLIKANEDFEDAWIACHEIDMSDPLFQQAFEQVNLDVDAVKLNILQQRQ